MRSPTAEQRRISSRIMIIIVLASTKYQIFKENKFKKYQTQILIFIRHFVLYFSINRLHYMTMLFFMFHGYWYTIYWFLSTFQDEIILNIARAFDNRSNKKKITIHVRWRDLPTNIVVTNKCIYVDIYRMVAVRRKILIMRYLVYPPNCRQLRFNIQ